MLTRCTVGEEVFAVVRPATRAFPPSGCGGELYTPLESSKGLRLSLRCQSIHGLVHADQGRMGPWLGILCNIQGWPGPYALHEPVNVQTASGAAMTFRFGTRVLRAMVPAMPP